MSATPPMATSVMLPPQLPLRVCIAALILMIAAAAAAWLATPHLQAVQAAPNLEATVPAAFGDWRVVSNSRAQVDVSQGVETQSEQPYDQTVMRTYANSLGEQVMLALAWGQRQRQDVKVHRPEVCYPAQGFNVLSVRDGGPLKVAGRDDPIPTVSMRADLKGTGVEAVRYWIRIGRLYGGDGLTTRWYIFQEGLAARIPDGILVRASRRVPTTADADAADAMLGSFLAELTAAVPAPTRALLVQ